MLLCTTSHTREVTDGTVLKVLQEYRSFPTRSRGCARIHLGAIRSQFDERETKGLEAMLVQTDSLTDPVIAIENHFKVPCKVEIRAVIVKKGSCLHPIGHVKRSLSFNRATKRDPCGKITFTGWNKLMKTGVQGEEFTLVVALKLTVQDEIDLQLERMRPEKEKSTCSTSSESSNSSSSSSSGSTSTSSRRPLLNDLRREYDVQELSDTQIVFGKRSYPCNKFLLCARSPVFKAMFRQPMRESSDSACDLSNLVGEVSHVAVEQLLSFLYCDRIDRLESVASDLLALSHYLDIPQLVSKCERSLLKNLDVGNSARTLLAAFTYSRDSAVPLFKEASEFCLFNFTDVFVTKDFGMVLENESLVECLLAISANDPEVGFAMKWRPKK